MISRHYVTTCFQRKQKSNHSYVLLSFIKAYELRSKIYQVFMFHLKSCMIFVQTYSISGVHGGAVVTQSPATFKVGSSNPGPYVGKLVVAN